MEYVSRLSGKSYNVSMGGAVGNYRRYFILFFTVFSSHLIQSADWDSVDEYANLGVGPSHTIQQCTVALGREIDLLNKTTRSAAEKELLRRRLISSFHRIYQRRIKDVSDGLNERLGEVAWTSRAGVPDEYGDGDLILPLWEPTPIWQRELPPAGEDKVGEFNKLLSHRGFAVWQGSAEKLAEPVTIDNFIGRQIELKKGKYQQRNTDIRQELLSSGVSLAEALSRAHQAETHDKIQDIWTIRRLAVAAGLVGQRQFEAWVFRRQNEMAEPFALELYARAKYLYDLSSSHYDIAKFLQRAAESPYSNITLQRYALVELMRQFPERAPVLYAKSKIWQSPIGEEVLGGTIDYYLRLNPSDQLIQDLQRALPERADFLRKKVTEARLYPAKPAPHLGNPCSKIAKLGPQGPEAHR